MSEYFGELAGLMAAICWTATALAFESAGKKIGSLSVNLIRLIMAIVLLGIYTWISRGLFLPVDASIHHWKYLALSGIIGFAIGDLLLFEAYVVIGARTSMLIMSFTPPITGIIGWIIMGEQMSFQNLLGMGITLTGIVLVVINRNKLNKKNNPEKSPKDKKRISYYFIGVLLAFGGAVGQATGLVLSKFGMQDYDAFAATQIRVIAGTIGFVIIFFLMRRWKKVFAALKNRKAMKGVTIGAFFGPFLGVSFSLLAVQNTLTGIASTLMALVPVMIIPPAVIFFKEKVNAMEIIGAIIAFVGVGMFFL